MYILFYHRSVCLWIPYKLYRIAFVLEIFSFCPGHENRDVQRTVRRIFFANPRRIYPLIYHIYVYPIYISWRVCVLLYVWCIKQIFRNASVLFKNKPAYSDTYKGVLFLRSTNMFAFAKNNTRLRMLRMVVFYVCVQVGSFMRKFA